MVGEGAVWVRMQPTKRRNRQRRMIFIDLLLTDIKGKKSYVYLQNLLALYSNTLHTEIFFASSGKPCNPLFSMCYF